MEMFDPPHPGEVIKDALEGMSMTIKAFAAHLGVSRTLLSRVVNGRAPITADLSIRLTEAFGQPTPSLWLKMQNGYDLWQASHAKRETVAKLDWKDSE